MSADSDSSTRSFDKEEMSTYAESSDFDYMNLVVQPPSIWQRIKWWFQNLLSEIFSNPNAPLYTKLLFYSILFFVLGGAIFYIVRLKYGSTMTTESKGLIYHSSSLENVQTTDFDGMIAGAIRDKNFKLAIRYEYLKVLALLSQKNLIKLKDWKSPFDYERELDQDKVVPYRNLSRLFEYVWYGDFEAGEQEYTRSSNLAKEIEVDR